MAQIFRQRIAQAEAMARADMLRFQPEVVLFLLLRFGIIKLSVHITTKILFSPISHFLYQPKYNLYILYYSIFRVDWVSVLMEFWDHCLKTLLILISHPQKKSSEGMANMKYTFFAKKLITLSEAFCNIFSFSVMRFYCLEHLR